MKQHMKLCAFILVSLFAILATANSLEIYVSQSGNDLNDGTRTRPFHTLERARDEARIRKSPSMTADIIVIVRPGNYFTSSPLLLDERDSGENGHRIIYTREGIDSPVIIGGQEAIGWSSTGMSSVFELFAGPSRFSSLYENGVPGIPQANLSQLDAPGEFYHDAGSGKLFYYPRNAPIVNQLIIIPRVSTIVSVEGSSPAGMAHDISFEGLTFFCSNFDPSNPEIGLIYIENARNITIKNCRILFSGNSGIVVNGASQNVSVDSNRVYMCGANGVTLSGYLPGEGLFASPGASYVNSGNSVTNNYIGRCGGNFSGLAGIHIIQSGNNTIAYNTIEGIRGSGIVLDGKPGIIGTLCYGRLVDQASYFDFVHSRNNRIEFNNILGLEFDSERDSGFYTKDCGRDNLFANNTVHDIFVAKTGLKEAAIFADYPTSFLAIKNNFVYGNRASDARVKPLLIRGNDLTIENNVVSDNDPFHAFVMDKGTGRGANVKFSQNVSSTNNCIYFYYFENLSSALFDGYDYNLFHHPGGMYKARTPTSMPNEQEWKSYYSCDFNSIFGLDPQFEDPGSRLYTAKPGSPALGLGFKNPVVGVKSVFELIGIPSSFEYRYASDTIEAERLTSGFGVDQNKTSVLARGIGESIMYGRLYFEQGLIQCRLRLACEAAPDSETGRSLEIRIGGIQGPVIGSVNLKGTGSISSYELISVPVFSTQASYSDLYLVLTGSGPRVQIDSFRFLFSPVQQVPQTTNIPPYVEILAPKDNSVLPAHKPVIIKVNAVDVDGQIIHVRIYIDGTMFHESQVPAFEYTWNVGDPGAHTIKVIATDSGGLTESASIKLTSSVETNPPPTVKISRPAPDSVYLQSPVDEILVSVEAKDDEDGIEKVEFLVNNNFMFEKREAPYDFIWKKVQGGDYTIKVKAFDTKGAFSEASIAILVHSTGNLIGHWEFENPGNLGEDTALDNDAEIPSGRQVSGAIGSGLALDGTGFARTGKSLMNHLKQFTLAGFIKPKIITSYSGLFGQNGVITFGFFSKLDDKYLMQIGTNESGVLDYFYPFPPDQWHHVAIAGDANGLRIYIDGVLKGKSDSSNSAGYRDSTGSFNIGGGIWHDYGDFFTGIIDDVRLYNVALSDRELAALGRRTNNKPPTIKIKEPVNLSTLEAPADILIKGDAKDDDGIILQVDFYANDELLFSDTEPPYEHDWSGVMPGSYSIKVEVEDNEGVSASDEILLTVILKGDSLIGHWSFDEGSGEVAHDSSGNRFDGKLIGGTWHEGVKGGCIRFGGEGYVQVERGILNNMRAFTLAGWIKPEDSGYRIGFWGQGGVIEFGFGAPKSINLWTGATGSLDTEYPFPFFEWHHIAAVGTGESILLYMDGKPAGKLDWPTENYGASDMVFSIGGGGIFDRVGNYFLGMMDDVYVYNKALTEAEIASLSNPEGNGPEVTISKPRGSETFNAPCDVQIEVEVKGGDAPILVVVLFINSLPFPEDAEEPYSFLFHATKGGTYDLRAKATDRSGLWSEDRVSIIISSDPAKKDDVVESDKSGNPGDENQGEHPILATKYMHSSQYEAASDSSKAESGKTSGKVKGTQTKIASGTKINTSSKTTMNKEMARDVSVRSGNITAYGPKPTEPPDSRAGLRYGDSRAEMIRSLDEGGILADRKTPYFGIIAGAVSIVLVAGIVIFYFLSKRRRTSGV